jgi:hypothetical protein
VLRKAQARFGEGRLETCRKVTRWPPTLLVYGEDCLSEAQSRRKWGSPQETVLAPVFDVGGNATISCQSFCRSLPVRNGKRRKGHLEHELRFLEATWGCPNHREVYGYRVTKVVAEVTLRRGL